MLGGAGGCAAVSGAEVSWACAQEQTESTAAKHGTANALRMPRVEEKVGPATVMRDECAMAAPNAKCVPLRKAAELPSFRRSTSVRCSPVGADSLP